MNNRQEGPQQKVPPASLGFGRVTVT